jgi:hypothetical protein
MQPGYEFLKEGCCVEARAHKQLRVWSSSLTKVLLVQRQFATGETINSAKSNGVGERDSTRRGRHEGISQKHQPKVKRAGALLGELLGARAHDAIGGAAHIEVGGRRGGTRRSSGHRGSDSFFRHCDIGFLFKRSCFRMLVCY